jgi:transcriptional regulator with XRE-family HTH domain
MEVDMTEWAYPGDEAIRRAFLATVTEIMQEKGLTLKQFENRLEDTQGQLDYGSHERALGRAVKNLREEQHMTRKALAISAGIPLGLLIQVERGHGGQASLPEVCRIAHALKLRPHELMEHYEKAFKQASQSHADDSHSYSS